MNLEETVKKYWWAILIIAVIGFYAYSNGILFQIVGRSCRDLPNVPMENGLDIGYWAMQCTQGTADNYAIFTFSCPSEYDACKVRAFRYSDSICTGGRDDVAEVVINGGQSQQVATLRGDKNYYVAIYIPQECQVWCESMDAWRWQDECPQCISNQQCIDMGLGTMCINGDCKGTTTTTTTAVDWWEQKTVDDMPNWLAVALVGLVSVLGFLIWRKKH